MANQTEDPPVPSAEMVGTAFVEQYYRMLNERPDDVYKFYAKDSVLSRPEADGTMTTVETIGAINEKILSMECHNYEHLHILTIDSQFSLANGVIVLVTGYIIGSDKVRRRFTQTFFLATQETGYFVLNDIFKFVLDESTNNYDVSYAAEDKPTVSLTSDDVVSGSPIPSQAMYEVDNANANEVNHVVKDCEESEKTVIAEKSVVAENNVVEKGVDARQSVNVVANHMTEGASSNTQSDAPKKTFASIVNALIVNKAPFNVRTPPPKPVERSRAAVPVTTVAVTARNNSTASPMEKNAPAVKTHAIFVANLSMSATVEQLEKLFTQFGSIKRDGIQIRSNKLQGTCFGVVEFESAAFMQNAIKASPVEFGGRLLSIEERRANNNRGKFSSGKGGYRNENYKSRENYNRENYGRENYSGGESRVHYEGGRGYGRTDFRSESSQFSGQARGNAHQSSHQNAGKIVWQTMKPVTTT